MTGGEGALALARELEGWHAAGRTATLWLRDDDACADSPALARLLSLARESAVPVAIAAIPAGVDATLVRAIDASGEATVVQHGYAHRNHAPPGARSAELAEDRDREATLAELARGRLQLAQSFGERFVPILVPPWNRVADALLPDLPGVGFAGLSRFAPRRAPFAAAGLREVNAHVDPIAWKRDRAFIGEAAAFERVVAHLRARRVGACDPDEPTGLLTHHLAFADDAWAFVRALLAQTRAHPAARWLGVREAFAATAGEPISARCA